MGVVLKQVCAGLILVVPLLAVTSARAGDREADAARTEGVSLSHWRAGPFFEYRRSRAHGLYTRPCEEELRTYWAFRPFYSRVSNISGDAVTHDVLWPLGTWHHQGSAFWHRELIAYGDGRRDDPSWSFNVFPLWFSGRARTGEHYWGAFPLYGNHPHLLLMDDWSFILWPIWQTYTVKETRSRAVLWPFVTWRDAPREGVGVWPIYGQARLRESEHGYALWPFVTWAAYEEDRDTPGAGEAWMVWPFCGRVRRAREKQTLIIPPFFSYAETDSARRWRLPWPLVEVLLSDTRDRVNVWPFYESVVGRVYAKKGVKGTTEERTRRYGWYLVEDTTLESAVSRETRFTVFPFWTSEHRFKKTSSGAWTEVAAFTRVWPFWCSSAENGKTRQTALALNPIRHSEGIERNWAPFWTFWSSETRPNGRTRHSVFWNLFRWHTSTSDVVKPSSKESVGHTGK